MWPFRRKADRELIEDLRKNILFLLEREAALVAALEREQRVVEELHMRLAAFEISYGRPLDG